MYSSILKDTAVYCVLITQFSKICGKQNIINSTFMFSNIISEKMSNYWTSLRADLYQKGQFQYSIFKAPIASEHFIVIKQSPA